MLRSDRQEITVPSSAHTVQVIRSPRFSYRWCLELLWNLAFQRVHLRYKETFLGFGWIFLQPVALTIIFNYIRRVADIPTGKVPYTLFVAAGLVPWSFTSLAISQSSACIFGNSSLLKRMVFPKILLPLSTILSTMADLLVMAFLLVGLFIYHRFCPSASVLWLPLIFLVHLVLLVGLACLLSLAHVFLRDLGYAIPHLLWLWFFASPVFYPASMVPKEFKGLAVWNPMVGLIEGYRNTLLLGKPPSPDLFLPTIAVSVGMFLLGLTAFRVSEGVLVDML